MIWKDRALQHEQGEETLEYGKSKKEYLANKPVPIQWLERLQKWMYPHKCIFCQSILEEGNPYFCPLCLSKLEEEQAYIFRNEDIESYKIRDGSAFEMEETEDCSQKEKIIAALSYNNEYRYAILRWKYRGIRRYAKGFARLVIERLEALQINNIQVLIPVPLASSRQRKRGFNQALDLAYEISKIYPSEVWDILTRIRDTKPQSACTRQERYTNVKGSIRLKTSSNEKIATCTEPIKSVALVDDIYTTGSTINECIRTLKQVEELKNTEFYVIILARGNL